MSKPYEPWKRNPAHGPPNEEALTEEDLETVRLLRAGLDELEALVPVFEPPQQWLEAKIAEHESALRKRFVRDLALFLSVAVVVLFGMAAAYLKVPVLFILLQAAALLAAPAILLGKKRKRVKGL